MTTVISIGYRCSTSALIKNAGLKHESYPFDWLISKLAVVKDCIDTRFTEFMNDSNYLDIVSPTTNICDDEVIDRGNQFMAINTFYQAPYGATDTHSYQLAMPHNNIYRDKEYYERCISRFYTALESSQQKLLVYIHPLLGSKMYTQTEEEIIIEFMDFANFIHSRYTNATCLFFTLVRGLGPKYTCIYNADSTIIYKIETNPAASDYGLILYGDYHIEQSILEYLIKHHTTI
jgi:hypothetical protein